MVCVCIMRVCVCKYVVYRVYVMVYVACVLTVVYVVCYGYVLRDLWLAYDMCVV